MDETQPLLRNGDVPGTHTNGSIEPPGSGYDDGNTDDNTKTTLPSSTSSEDPQLWTPAFKWGITCLLAFTAFTVTFTCISVVPIASQIVADLDSHSHRKSSRSGSTASVLLVTIWELGEAAGPLLIAPLSETYGRYPVFNAANGLFIISVALAALSESTSLLIAARFLTGCAVASNVLNPAIIGDMFPTEQRGSAMSLVMLAPLVGGAIGPAIAGVIAQTVGWRRVMWMSFALACVCEVVFLFLFRETYRPAILRKAAGKLGVGGEGEGGEAEGDNDANMALTKSPILASITRPARILWSSVVLQMLSLYGAVTFAFFYVLSTTLPEILSLRYDFPPALIGTSFLTFSVGSVVSIGFCNTLIDRIYLRLQPNPTPSQPNPPKRPEARLPLAIIGALCLPFILTLYGWSAALHLPVSVLLLSVGLQGGFVMLTMVPLMSYVVDAFGIYSASAMTAVLITRCLMGTFLPLLTAPLVEWLGWGWGFVVLAGLAAALAPVPALVMRFGGAWREWSRYSRDG